VGHIRLDAIGSLTDPALFTDSNGYPLIWVVNVLYPWTTWDAMNAALAEGRNWTWFNGP
jgi:hypothetical protein